MCEYLNFKELNLHDCKVYAWGILSESHKLLMDVDWIVSWNISFTYIPMHFCIFQCMGCKYRHRHEYDFNH